VSSGTSFLVRSAASLPLLRLASVLASERPRSRNFVARRHRPVQIEFDTRICALVRTGEADRRRRRCSTSRNVDLRTLHIHLGARIAASSVQSDNLSAKQIPIHISIVHPEGRKNLLSILNALRQREFHLTLVVVKTCHSPFALRIHSVLVNLEPLESCDGSRQGTVDLGEVDHDGP